MRTSGWGWWMPCVPRAMKSPNVEMGGRRFPCCARRGRIWSCWTSCSPHKSGYDLCREIRGAKNRVPILMLSAKGQEIDKVVGLELGADDYVTKPFSLRELLARVQALLRRAEPPVAAAEAPEEMRFGTVSVDCRALRGKRGKEAFELTPRELRVLALLHRERGKAVSRDAILNEVWGIEYYGTTRTLDQLIVKLRQKIEAVPAEPRYLLTVHGLGYRLEA